MTRIKVEVVDKDPNIPHSPLKAGVVMRMKCPYKLAPTKQRE
jgi:hypothetical protein